MSNILVTVNEQKLHITQAPTIAAQGVNEDYVVFTLDSYWSGFGIVAFFYRKDDPEHVYQAAVNSSTGKALIPHEVCVEDGVICFGIYGVKNSIIYTSEEQRYRIVKGQYVPNASPSEPITPGIYEQILSLVGGLEQEMAEFISTYSGYGHETTLWTGQKGANGDTFSLSDNASNYDYIDVFYTFSGIEDVKTFLASNFANGAYIRSTNLSDDSTGTSPLMAAELKITPTTSGNDKNYTINSKRWTWSGEASAAGSQVNPDSTNYQAGYIFKVVGRKRESDSEIINARIGYDGTTYSSAGAAIRTQVSDLHTGKQDVLTFDTEPTEDSTNPITSGAVYEIAEEVTSLSGDLSDLIALSPLTTYDGKLLNENFLIGTHINNSGEIIQSPSYALLANFIGVNVGDTIKYTVVNSDTVLFIALFDKDKQFISRENLSESETTTIPNGCVYILFSIGKTSNVFRPTPEWIYTNFNVELNSFKWHKIHADIENIETALDMTIGYEKVETTFVIGQNINSTGTIVTANSYALSDYVQAEGNCITLYTPTSTDCVLFISEFDQSKTFIQRGRLDTDISIQLGEETKYIRFGIGKTDYLFVPTQDWIGKNFNVKLFGNVLENKFNALEAKLDDTEILLNSPVVYSGRIETAFVLGRNINADGTIKPDAQNYALSDFVSVNEGSSVIYSPISADCVLFISEFDESKTFIQRGRLDTYISIELGATTKYIRFGIGKAYGEFIVTQEWVGANFNVQLRSQLYKYSNSIGMQLFEKIGVIGDSISVGWAKDKNGNNSRRNTGISWVQQMARRLGCTSYNLGASGVDPIEWFQSSYEFAQYCYTQYQSVGACDLYIIGLGLNEGTLGSISDINQSDYTQNGATFYGQYARIIQMINDEHPDAIVMCLTEPTTKISTYDQAVRDICELNYIKAELVDLENDYFDLFNTAEIIAEQQPDGLHYTPYGYSLIADAMMSAINDYISKNTAKFKYVGVETV